MLNKEKEKEKERVNGIARRKKREWEIETKV
jgi:hypothetical protein